jgi:diketogulonate reductase-like aldo/keto reductase
MRKSIEIPTLTLNDGLTLPAIGLGTYRLDGEAGVAAMVGAIRSGYRLLDTAINYGNEAAVGEAVRKSGVARAELRVSSKLPGRHHRYAQAIADVEESVRRSGLDYLDLYLIHWPNPNRGLYVEAWEALIECRKRGLTRSIGVSNFLPDHLDRLIRETGVTPSVNQIELHPYFPQEGQRQADRERGVVTQGWSPLFRNVTMLSHEDAVVRVAARLHRTAAQVVLRWHVQLGAVPLPKAAPLERQVENLALFDFALSAEDMAAIATLARPDGRMRGQDPAHYEEF